MGFSTNGAVVLADATPANVTYSEVSNTGSQCLYADRTRDIGVPRQLIISHQTVGSGPNARRRSMVKVTDFKENASLEGDVVEARVHMVVDIPQRIIDSADVNHMVVQLKNLIISTDFLAKLLNQEV